MALDTQTKRASAIHPGCPWRGLLPAPSGALQPGERPMVAYLYAGITVWSGSLRVPAHLLAFPPRHRLLVLT